MNKSTYWSEETLKKAAISANLTIESTLKCIDIENLETKREGMKKEKNLNLRKEVQSVGFDKTFDIMLEKATESVRPPRLLIKFYNFMARIPFRIGTLIFLLTAIDTVRVAINAMHNRTDAALQVIYQYRFRPWRLFWGLGDHFWQMSYNCRSVRARGIFTREAISYLLRNVVTRNHIIIVSLGSGSAGQILQGVANSHLSNNEVHLILVDNDIRALEAGRRNARRLGIEDLINSREETVGMFLKRQPFNSVDFVEMVGLTDYFEDNRFSSYLANIYGLIKEDGFFLGANISNKEEAAYAHGVACWPHMYYRQKEEIIKKLKETGFKDNKIWIGDCGLYTFYIAQK